MDPNDLGNGNPVGWFTAGGIGLAWGLTWLRKLYSSTNASVANDRAEKDMLDRLTGENDKLREHLETVTRERNEMYKTIGELTGTMKAMKSQLDLQESHITQLTQEVAQLRQAMQRNGNERRISGEAS
jgi:chromosome segregation ATPase